MECFLWVDSLICILDLSIYDVISVCIRHLLDSMKYSGLFIAARPHGVPFTSFPPDDILYGAAKTEYDISPPNGASVCTWADINYAGWMMVIMVWCTTRSDRIIYHNTPWILYVCVPDPTWFTHKWITSCETLRYIMYNITNYITFQSNSRSNIPTYELFVKKCSLDCMFWVTSKYSSKYFIISCWLKSIAINHIFFTTGVYM